MDFESVRVETDLLEHREVKPHFINPCCFGEDFARWVVSTGYDPGLNLLKRLFHRPDAAALARVRERVRQALASHSAIRILDDEGAS